VKNLKACLVGQMQIEKNHIGRLGPNMRKACRPGGGYVDAMGRSGEGLPHLLGDQAGIVIDEQQMSHDSLAFGASAARFDRTQANWHSIRSTT
jgi:hypothetical protein